MMLVGFECTKRDKNHKYVAPENFAMNKVNSIKNSDTAVHLKNDGLSSVFFPLNCVTKRVLWSVSIQVEIFSVTQEPPV